MSGFVGFRVSGAAGFAGFGLGCSQSTRVLKIKGSMIRAKQGPRNSQFGFGQKV